MDITAFKESLDLATPPAGITVQLTALWYDGKDNWRKAHDLVDQLTDATSCWVHAYLHRKEGDIWNADYWYRRAGKKRPDISLQQEWETIVEALL